MTSRRFLPAAICVLAMALCVLSVFEMAGRVRRFNAQADLRYYTFLPIDTRTFSVFGREVSVVDVPGENDAGTGWSVRLKYGDVSVQVPVKKPAMADAPGLSIYDEWFAVVAFSRMVPKGEGTEATLTPAAEADANGAAGASAAPETQKDARRMVAMTRVPPPGYDPATWGAVKRVDWSFRFYELKPDGTIEETVRRWPRSAMSEKALTKMVAGELGTPAEQSVAKLLIGIEPLDERSLEYQLALNVIPKLNVPSYKFKNTAMEAMGWTLPTAFFSMLAAIVLGAVAFAPKLKK